MDKFDDEAINNLNNSKHVYKMHDSNAYTLDVVCVNSSNNNNNNEKMDDANQTITPAANQRFGNTMRQDSTNSDFSLLTDSIQTNADDRHKNGIDMRTDDEYSLNDNQSNASDEASDNNSTDNISFVSEDIVENIIVLPNNFLSDDESTNSDDVIYAYRGADFEPVQLNVDVNADEETDYLEMDFEPDPASEIEQEPNQSNEASSHIATAPPQSAFNVMPNSRNNESGDNILLERTGMHKNWLAPIEVRHNGIYKINDTTKSANPTNRSDNIDTDGINIHMENNNKVDVNADSIEKESNKSLETKNNANKATALKNGDAFSTYYDNTVSLSTKKYTGTIPKTSKIHVRPLKSKPTTSDYANNCSGHRIESQPSSSVHSTLDLWTNPSNPTHKRWKISDKEKPASTSFCDNLGDFTVEADTSYAKRWHVAARSMSFPNEDLMDQRIPTAVINAVMCAPEHKREVENDIEQPATVTFESTFCTIDTIIKALEKVHVLPNLRILQKVLRDGENKVSQMNIPEYLVYASKRYCNYKAIAAAIEQSCDDVDVKCYLDGSLETVNIPLRMIASRLPTNGSLNNILTIKNRRFHQMNVLGKIVNMVRRFPNMRDDLIQNEFITIPQYYRSGVICVSKKKSSPNET